MKVTEKEKSSIPSKNTIDFDKGNVRRKKKLLKKLKHVDHKDINLSWEDFSHISRLLTIVESKKEDSTNCIQIKINRISTTVQVKTF